ncbi:MAG: LLM class flavin-dependent oxidoreductase [Solirubrobacterales bacterium]|nr:LLM class flavin-dependent oxidoreductase [Solirubrobacterales bacterium]
MQLTMEPVPEVLEHARQLDRNGFDTIWLAEAYPWWRKHGMEARSSTALSPLIARETKRLAVGWGIISPYTRHPIQVAMDARVMQEMTAGGEAPRFLLGYGASKIFMNHAAIGAGEERARPYTVTKDAIRIVRGVLEGEAFDYEGKELSAHVPALASGAESPHGSVPIYVAGTGPRMQELSGELGDGLLTASITTPAFVGYAKDNMRRGAAKSGRDVDELDLGCTIVASIDEHDSTKGREGAREIAGMYLANKVQNIKGSADVLLEKAGLELEEIEPIAAAMERGGRRAAAEAVSDEILAKCRPIAGTPRECIEAIAEYREAGCTHVMLELWGEDRDRQIEVFGRRVLPEVRSEVAA